MNVVAGKPHGNMNRAVMPDNQLVYLEGKILGLEFLSLTLVTSIFRVLSETTLLDTRLNSSLKDSRTRLIAALLLSKAATWLRR